MNLIGFKARNHPQQKAKPHVDDRAITLEDFAPLMDRFGFTIDVAASAENARLPRYFDIALDGLEQPWVGARVWCNPPYSNIEPWIEKAWAEWGRSKIPGGTLIVMLLPANRTEQGWWQRQVEPHLRSGDLRVEFLPGRMRFLKPGADEIKPNERPPFGCCLLIWGTQ